MRRVWRGYRRLPRWAQITVAVILGAVLIGSASSTRKHDGDSASSKSATTVTSVPASVPAATTTPTTEALPKDEQDARSYILDHASDAYQVQANLENVEADLGSVINSSTVANIDQLAEDAQSAHDNIDTIRTDFTTSDTSGTLGNAELDTFAGANELKNAMGAIVAYTGSPNPATLASMTSQLKQGISEWNNGVTTIWQTARRAHPPTV